MFVNLSDPDLPALATLDRGDLARITGTAGARLLRARYTPGARAVLHVGLGAAPDEAEGSVWFYAGTKAQKLARRLPDARLDPATGALFQAFPQDHRMPHLARFVAEAMDLAPRLIGGAAASPPRLMRYRPGLSATFRWTATDGRIFYVKLTPTDDVAAQALAVDRLRAATRGLSVGFAPVAGQIADLWLIAYEAAPGRPLDHLLAQADGPVARSTVAQVTAALRALWSCPVVPGRPMDRDELLLRADRASRMIGFLDRDAGGIAADLVATLQARAVTVRRCPIHADMKLEHALLSDIHTTLIDTESLSLGDPDYDLAKLEARLWMAAATGTIPAAAADAAMVETRRHAGPDYDWFLTCARLQCARFFAQRFDPASVPLMRRLLTLP